MLNRAVTRNNRKRMRCIFPHRTAVVFAIIGMLAQTGCLFKSKAPAAPKTPGAPTRVAFLPLNVPDGTADLHWIAVAAAVTSVEVALAAPDIEPVPLWESIPAALQSLGPSRTVNSDIAETTAARLSARWALEGEVKNTKVPKSTKMVLTMRMDFIASKANSVPFRYENPIQPDKLSISVQEAYEQFLRYLIVREIQPDLLHPLDSKSLRAVAEAVDGEYGWFATTPKPGGFAPVVDSLARTNPKLAKLLFSPTMYPILAK